MKNLFNRIISLICAVTLIICALSVCAAAEEASATPTDLQEESVPAQEAETADGQEEDYDEQADNHDEQAENHDEQVEDQETEQKEEEDYADESSGSPVESVEIIITRTMTLGESWNGVTGTSRLVVLKLDISKAQTVHMIVEGRNTWASVQKSDRIEENPRTVLTDPETRRAIITWEAEQGSYLITIGPEEPNLMAKAQVTFLDDEAYAAWEEEQEINSETIDEEEVPTEGTVEETEEEPETTAVAEEDNPEAEKETTDEEPETVEENPGEPVADTEDVTEEAEQELEEESDQDTVEEQDQTEKSENEEDVLESNGTQDRYVTVELTWDVEYPIIGDTAHLTAILYGYDGLDYTVQWYNSADRITWNEIPGATDSSLDVIADGTNNHLFWRFVVYLEDNQE